MYAAECDHRGKMEHTIGCTYSKPRMDECRRMGEGMKQYAEEQLVAECSERFWSEQVLSMSGIVVCYKCYGCKEVCVFLSVGLVVCAHKVGTIAYSNVIK